MGRLGDNNDVALPPGSFDRMAAAAVLHQGSATTGTCVGSISCEIATEKRKERRVLLLLCKQLYICCYQIFHGCPAMKSTFETSKSGDCSLTEALKRVMLRSLAREASGSVLGSRSGIHVVTLGGSITAGYK